MFYIFEKTGRHSRRRLINLVIATSFLCHCAVRVWCWGLWQPPCQPKEKARISQNHWPNAPDGSALKPPGSRLSWCVITKCLRYLIKFSSVFSKKNNNRWNSSLVTDVWLPLEVYLTGRGLALGGGHCEKFLSGILMIYAYCYAYFNWKGKKESL